MPFKGGKFLPAGAVKHKPNASTPTISSRKQGAAPEKDKHANKHVQDHGAPQAPHDQQSQEKHVTESHPGKTQPHPTTGVHAHHVHHTGTHASGGPAYTSHTHHDDGTVETRENRSQDEVEQDQHEAFPNDMSADNELQEPQQEGEFSESLEDGVGGVPV